MINYQFNLALNFKHICSKFNHNTAIEFNDGSFLNYEELDRLSDKISSYLITKKIVQGNVVAILNDKSCWGYAAMLACLKLGVIYTNLDINSPVARLKKIIQISQPSHFLINSSNINKLTTCGILEQQLTDYTSDEFHNNLNGFQSDIEISREIHGDSPAYLMFTSGSTGFPKGVIITHSNIQNFIQWSRVTFNVNYNDRITNLNPLHFDNSVFDFYVSLFNGATLLSIPDSLPAIPLRLIETLNRLKPSIWFSVPSLLVFVLKSRALKASDLLSLNSIIFGGEGFPKNQLRILADLIGSRTQLINVYGPTEGTCICSSYLVKPQDLIDDGLLPLGEIADNFSFCVLDKKNNPVCEDAIGELCLSGPNIAKGYYNNLQKTEELFIQNPKNNAYSDIIYKTGDLVTFNRKNKLLKFCGRRDNQIKRMGYRIELEEIENALSDLDYISESAVIYNKTDNDNGVIIACISANINQEDNIIEDLREFIPSYMLPNKLLFLEELPKNQNGKIDRMALKREYC